MGPSQSQKQSDGIGRSDYRAFKVTDGNRETLHEIRGEGKLLRVTPFPENPGIKASEQILQHIHEPIEAWRGYKNRSRVESFEIWFENGRVNFQYYLPDREDRQRERNYRSLIDAFYKHSSITEVNGLFPVIKEGEYIAGVEFDLAQTRHYPIRSVDGVEEFVYDPYRPLISAMTNTDEHRSVLQFVYKPALESWSRGGPLGWANPWAKPVDDISENTEGMYLDAGIDADGNDGNYEKHELSDVISARQHKPAFHINARFLAISPIEKVAQETVREITSEIRTEYGGVTGQTLSPPKPRREEVTTLADRMYRRDFHDNQITLTVPELAGLAHIPNHSIDADSVEWHRDKPAGHVPDSADRFVGSM